MWSRQPRRSAIAELRDRDLVRLYWPVELRPAFDALLDIDEAMAEIVAKATEPALAAIKLAWWRERLQELDEGKAPAEPRLQAASAELLRRGVTGANLSGFEDGWAALLDETPDLAPVAASGVRLFKMAARLLDDDDPMLAEAGRLYALQHARRRVLVAVPPPSLAPALAGSRFGRRLRPLTCLAALAARDSRQLVLEPEATPGRAWALIRHRLTGRVA